MKVVLTTGFEHSGYQLVHGILRDAGLIEAQPSRREHIRAVDLQVKLLKAFTASGEKPATGSPGKLWEELAVDLFLAHLETPAWGWADHNTMRLLDFWRRFDKQTRFVLVYSSPEFAIAQTLQDQEATPEALSKVVQAWSDQTKALLRFQRRFQGRCELVNSMGALQAPAQLVERLSQRWGIPLRLGANYAAPRHDFSTVAASLARCVVRQRDDARPLYATLESCSGVSEELGSTEELQAWNDYSAERKALAAAKACVKELEEALALANAKAAAAEQQRKQSADLAAARAEAQAQLTALKQQAQKLIDERDQQVRVAAERLSHINSLQKQATASVKDLEDALALANTKAAAALEQQRQHAANLTKARDDLQAQVTALKQQSQKLIAERDAQAKLAEERRAQLDALRAPPSASNGANSTELLQEIELLQLQLHQMQEELEHYYLANQELTRRLTVLAGADSHTRQFWRDNQPTEVIVDLRREIDGGNWYEAEADGRWAGPGKTSTLRIPALASGRYVLVLHVADSMSPEIMQGMQVTLNGSLIVLTGPDEVSLPTTLQGPFSSEVAGRHDQWQFEFSFPATVSPTERGSTDERLLAIRLNALELIITESSAQ